MLHREDKKFLKSNLVSFGFLTKQHFYYFVKPNVDSLDVAVLDLKTFYERFFGLDLILGLVQ